mgnify:CR=1 FL=1
MYAEVGSAIALVHGAAQRQTGQFGTAAGALHHQRVRTRSDGIEALVQAQLPEAPRYKTDASTTWCSGSPSGLP